MANLQWTPEQIAALTAENAPPYVDRKLVFIKGKFAGEFDLPAQRKPLYQMSAKIRYGEAKD